MKYVEDLNKKFSSFKTLVGHLATPSKKSIASANPTSSSATQYRDPNQDQQADANFDEIHSSLYKIVDTYDNDI